MRKAVLVFLTVAIAVGAGLWVWRTNGPDEAGLVAYGNVEVRQVELAFEVEGRIAEVLVEEGDRVRAGQPVARIEPGYFEDTLAIAEARAAAQAAVVGKLSAGSRPEEIARAEAEVAAARAEVENARRDFDRQKDLADRQVASQAKLDQARRALDTARARLNVAEENLTLARKGPRGEDLIAAEARLRADRATVDLARRRLSDAELSAPADGVIVSRVREPGTVVTPGATVLTMAKTEPVWVRAFVPEPMLGLIQPGTPAEIVTDSRPDRPFTAHVGFISPVAEFTPKTVQTPDLRTDLVYRIRVIVDEAGAFAALRQGMPVTVRLRPGDGG